MCFLRKVGLRSLVAAPEPLAVKFYEVTNEFDVAASALGTGFGLQISKAGCWRALRSQVKEFQKRPVAAVVAHELSFNLAFGLIAGKAQQLPSFKPY